MKLNTPDSETVFRSVLPSWTSFHIPAWAAAPDWRTSHSGGRVRRRLIAGLTVKTRRLGTRAPHIPVWSVSLLISESANRHRHRRSKNYRTPEPVTCIRLNGERPGKPAWCHRCGVLKSNDGHVVTKNTGIDTCRRQTQDFAINLMYVNCKKNKMLYNVSNFKRLITWWVTLIGNVRGQHRSVQKYLGVTTAFMESFASRGRQQWTMRPVFPMTVILRSFDEDGGASGRWWNKLSSYIFYSHLVHPESTVEMSHIPFQSVVSALASQESATMGVH